MQDYIIGKGHVPEMTEQYELTLHNAILEIPQQAWDSCACPEAADGGRPADPFTTARFLSALEDSGSVGDESGWLPRYAALRLEGELVACAPLYLKTHSQGEYIFDHNWAHAYEQAGGQYYPKLQVAVPFTPVTGRRLLVHPEHPGSERALLQGLSQLVEHNGLSGVHITFCTADEVTTAEQSQFMPRLTQQFHWQNEGYGCFDDFLASLSARKRKNISKERARAAAFGGEIECVTGDQIGPVHWEAMWEFYQDTGARKWGVPYLTREMFDRLHETMRDDVLLIFAHREGRYVAGAMNFIGRETLFGRYWGCVEDHPCLHFELCYYQAIDYAIKHGLSRVEAGAQGAHKLARGYLPSPTYSAHYIREPGFRRAIRQYLDEERRVTQEEIEILTEYGPFRNIPMEEHE